jgi:methyltransferase (TIGR00027 family)
MNDTEYQTDSALRNISDTALWVAVYRARESERQDRVFNDPYARRLAGERGEKISGEMMRSSMKYEWPFISRTVSFDAIVMDCVREGADMVINLAAGLDTRPYRLDLLTTLKWVEVDLPDMIDYKEGILTGESPRCQLERVKLDLTDLQGRQKLFARLSAEAKKVLVVTEGLTVYLSQDEVTALAQDLHAQPNFTDWATDLVTPALLKMLQKSFDSLQKANAPLKFAPDEGPDFFVPLGWRPVDIQSSLKVAARVKRLPLFLRLMALLPDSKGRKPKQVWGGAVRLTRS